MLAALPGRVAAMAYSDASGLQAEPTQDVGGGLDLGWVDAGDWVRYEVNVPTAGMYRLDVRVAAPAAVADAFTLSVSGGGGATLAVPATGGWQSWTTVTMALTLPAGTRTITVRANAPGWNLDGFSAATG